MQKKWIVRVGSKADKQLKKLSADICALVDEFIADLTCLGPVPAFWDVKKIEENTYRVRLKYRYRMKYNVKINFLLIEIFYIGHRKDAY